MRDPDECAFYRMQATCGSSLSKRSSFSALMFLFSAQLIYVLFGLLLHFRDKKKERRKKEEKKAGELLSSLDVRWACLDVLFAAFSCEAVYHNLQDCDSCDYEEPHSHEGESCVRVTEDLTDCVGCRAGQP
jgi:hypothetical protein